MLSERMSALGTQRSVIRELFEYGRRRAAQVGEENVFDFSIGNPSVPAPARVTETLLRLIRESDPVALHGYTSAQGDPEARSAIAASLCRRFGVPVGPEHLYMTAGAAAALSCCLSALACPGDEFIVFAPYFPEYQVFIEQAGGRMVLIPADTERFQLNLAALEQALTPRTKAVLVNSPNNPSGAVYSPDTVRQLAQLLKAHSAALGRPVYLIADEPYREIVYDGVQVPFLPRFYENTLVCYSWSKSLSLPGERIGYVLVPPCVDGWQAVCSAIAGAGRALGYVNAPSLFQRVCAACCEDTADLSVYAANRRLLVDGLRAMGYEVIAPDGTFYLFPRSPEPDAGAFVRRAMARDLLLVPGDGFGCPGHVRISFCVPTRQVERALPIFAALAEDDQLSPSGRSS